jgi:hypothetical protein
MYFAQSYLKISSLPLLLQPNRQLKTLCLISSCCQRIYTWRHCWRNRFRLQPKWCAQSVWSTIDPFSSTGSGHQPESTTRKQLAFPKVSRDRPHRIWLRSKPLWMFSWRLALGPSPICPIPFPIFSPTSPKSIRQSSITISRYFWCSTENIMNSRIGNQNCFLEAFKHHCYRKSRRNKWRSSKRNLKTGLSFPI